MNTGLGAKQACNGHHGPLPTCAGIQLDDCINMIALLSSNQAAVKCVPTLDHHHGLLYNCSGVVYRNRKPGVESDTNLLPSTTCNFASYDSGLIQLGKLVLYEC